MDVMDRGEGLPLKVAVFLDGSPGHEKQTLGIVRALRRLHPLEETEIRIVRRSPGQEAWAWLRYLLGLDSPPAGIQGAFHLLIGTGSHTHIPMLSSKRHCHALCVTCMAPSILLRGRFDLCCVPEHDGIAARDNVLLTIGPPNCSIPSAEHDQSRGLVLLGGVDEKSHFWNSVEIAESVRTLAITEKDKRWTVSSSPRTPAATIILMEGLAKELENVEFFRYENTASGWVEEQYGGNGTVWVSADSMSMIYEALSAGCNLGIIPVAWKDRNNKFSRSERFLLEHGLVVSFDAWKKGAARWNSREPLDEAGRCAQAILDKLQSMRRGPAR